MFVPPRYKTLETETLDAFIKILGLLILKIPPSAFDPPASEADPDRARWVQDDDDSDEDSHPIAGPFSSMTIPKKPSLTLDARVRNRLRSLGSTKHASTLLAASNTHSSTRLELYGLFLALYTAWPACRPDVLASVLEYSTGGLLRELYRGHVRSSPIGKDDDPDTLVNPAYAKDWLPLLFLVDLYTQAQYTMNDEEFFASRSIAKTSASAIYRNPLTIDEVIAFSKRLMNIAFLLYWHEEIPAAEWVPIPWEAVRDKVTKLLQYIHARE